MTQRMLLIEDDAIQEQVLEWLGFEGYTAHGAVNGLVGVQAAFQQLPDLVICDIHTPEMDGYRVLINLRSHPSTALVPFLHSQREQPKMMFVMA